MNYSTMIDTIKLQADFHTALEQREALEALLGTLSISGRLFIQQKNHPTNTNNLVFKRDYFIYAHGTMIATITTGAFNEQSHTIGYTKYYISVKLAGLCRYNEKIDSISHYCLLKTCAFFNSNNIAFKLTELDVCIDAECEFHHLLALCVKKSPKTDYYTPSDMQAYTDTSYIEKIPYKKLEKSVLRAYMYNKSHKERLSQKITRFELKLQPKYFNKYSFDIAQIEKALNRYYVMYFKDSDQRSHVIEAYEKYQVFRKREIAKLGLDTYRLYPDIATIQSFLKQLLHVNDFEVWLMYECFVQNIHNTVTNTF